MVADLEGLAVEGDHLQAAAVASEAGADAGVEQVVDALENRLGVTARDLGPGLARVVVRQPQILDGLADGIDEVTPLRRGVLVYGDEAVHVEHGGDLAQAEQAGAQGVAHGGPEILERPGTRLQDGRVHQELQGIRIGRGFDVDDLGHGGLLVKFTKSVRIYESA